MAPPKGPSRASIRARRSQSSQRVTELGPEQRTRVLAQRFLWSQRGDAAWVTLPRGARCSPCVLVGDVRIRCRRCPATCGLWRRQREGSSSSGVRGPRRTRTCVCSCRPCRVPGAARSVNVCRLDGRADGLGLLCWGRTVGSPARPGDAVTLRDTGPGDTAGKGSCLHHRGLGGGLRCEAHVLVDMAGGTCPRRHSHAGTWDSR